MTVKQFLRRPGSVQLLDGTRKAFDVALLPVALVPAAQVVLSGYSLSWPDIVKDNSWYHVSIISGGTTRTETYMGSITAVAQKWGPAGSPGVTNTLADVVLGPAPAGADFVDVKFKINSRTKAPTAMLGDSLPPVPGIGKETRLIGGSCLIEEGAGFKRGFAIVISGGNIVLRRWQTFTADNRWDGGWQQWSNGNSPGNEGYFTYGSQKGQEVYILGGNVTASTSTSDLWQRGSSNQTSTYPLADITDFSSAYSVELVITPGRLNKSATLHPPSTRTPLRLGSGAQQTGSAVSSFTFSSAALGLADATRRIVVAVSAYTSVSPTGVTIAGVAATKLVDQQSGNHYAGLWIAAVPTGTSGSVVVSWAGASGLRTAITYWGLYNFSSGSAVATASLTTAGSASLGCTAGGVAFAVETHTDSGTNADFPSRTIGGLEQLGYDALNGSSASVTYSNHGFGYQRVTGTSHSPSFSFGFGGALVAASLF